MNSSFSLKFPISYSLTDAKNLKNEGAEGCATSLALTHTDCCPPGQLHRDLQNRHIKHLCKTFCTHAPLHVSISRSSFHMETATAGHLHSIESCKHGEVSTLQLIPTLQHFPELSTIATVKTIPQWNLPIQTKPRRDKNPHPLPHPNPTLGMPWCFYSNTAFRTLPALLGWTKVRDMLEAEPQSLSTVIIQCQVSRWQARWKTKEQRCGSFQCAYETGQNGSTWPGSQGEYGTKLAVKHICTQETRVDSKIGQSYRSSLVIKNGIL